MKLKSHNEGGKGRHYNVQGHRALSCCVIGQWATGTGCNCDWRVQTTSD